MTRVLVCEDQALVLDALARLLGREPGFEVVGQAGDGTAAIQLAGALTPDIVLLDIEMPGVDGIHAAEKIKKRHPGTHTVILTTFGRPGYVRRALAAGVSGFLLKDEPVQVLAGHLTRVMAGERIVDPHLAVVALTEGSCPLPPRELTILGVAQSGAPIAELARQLFLSEGTVRNHLSSIIQKLGVENRAQAVQRAQDQGWL